MRMVVFFLVVIGSSAKADELNSMRLFFEPEKPELKVDHPVPSVVPHRKISYHYNGFISSDAGIRYIVNGVLLSGLKRIELISVGDSGRTLELKTNAGLVFSLAIGETRVAALVQAEQKSE